jgi:hypothetical protein
MLEGAGTVHDSQSDQMLLAFLRERDAFCPVCKYNLRGLTVARCPECGRALQLTVGAVEPFWAAWITGTIAASGSSGIAVLLVAFSIWRWPHFVRWDEYFAFFSFVVSIPIAMALLIFRRRFLRLSRPVQWVLSSLVAVLTMTQIFLFVWRVR